MNVYFALIVGVLLGVFFMCILSYDRTVEYEKQIYRLEMSNKYLRQLLLNKKGGKI